MSRRTGNKEERGCLDGDSEKKRESTERDVEKLVKRKVGQEKSMVKAVK